MNKVYYKWLDIDKIKISLPKDIDKHAQTAESKSAWALLIECYKSVYKEDLPSVTFLKSGKPVIENGYISLSHSKGKVAVAFSKKINVGVDIELIKKDYPKKIAEFINYTGEPKGFYSLWTRRESTIKALNLSSLKKGVEGDFSGITTVVDGEYSLSVYGVNASFVEL